MELARSSRWPRDMVTAQNRNDRTQGTFLREYRQAPPSKASCPLCSIGLTYRSNDQENPCTLVSCATMAAATPNPLAPDAESLHVQRAHVFAKRSSFKPAPCDGCGDNLWGSAVQCQGSRAFFAGIATVVSLLGHERQSDAQAASSPCTPRAKQSGICPASAPPRCRSCVSVVRRGSPFPTSYCIFVATDSVGPPLAPDAAARPAVLQCLPPPAPRQRRRRPVLPRLRRLGPRRLRRPRHRRVPPPRDVDAADAAGPRQRARPPVRAPANRQPPQPPFFSRAAHRGGAPSSWVEGNLPPGSVCAACHKGCQRQNQLFGLRCANCHTTAHALCLPLLAAVECMDPGPLDTLRLPASAIVAVRCGARGRPRHFAGGVVGA